MIRMGKSISHKWVKVLLGFCTTGVSKQQTISHDQAQGCKHFSCLTQLNTTSKVLTNIKSRNQIFRFNSSKPVIYATAVGIFSSPEPKAHRRAYSIPMLRRLSLSSTIFKHLIRNRLTNQSQISCGDSSGWGNKS